MVSLFISLCRVFYYFRVVELERRLILSVAEEHIINKEIESIDSRIKLVRILLIGSFNWLSLNSVDMRLRKLSSEGHETELTDWGGSEPRTSAKHAIKVQLPLNRRTITYLVVNNINLKQVSVVNIYFYH